MKSIPVLAIFFALPALFPLLATAQEKPNESKVAKSDEGTGEIETSENVTGDSLVGDSLTGDTQLESSIMVNACPDGFESIFDGKTLAGWRGCPGRSLSEWQETNEELAAEWNTNRNQHWRVEGDELVNDGEGVFLTTEKLYGDFELLLQYRTVPGADSGIYLRGTPQVQIWDSTEERSRALGSDKGSGGLWNNSPGAAGKDPLVLADRPFGEWNQFRIRLVGERCSVWLNGQPVVENAPMENYWDRSSPLIAKGPIQLQTHGGEIRWRHLFVKEFSAEESNAMLWEQLDGDFRPLFDGKSLAGWQGDVEGYEVVDGAIQCKKGNGGNLFTKEKFSDFLVALEFQLPPAGNNGLIIRYPGSGDGAYAGMCELQVLDHDAPVYANLDPRQRHGSAYGMVPAKTGYLRKPGEWNFQIVSVEGSKIRVELNGTTILDADLSQVDSFLDDKPHPGKDLTSGHFGFAGHGDAVKYRNINLR